MTFTSFYKTAKQARVKSAGSLDNLIAYVVRTKHKDGKVIEQRAELTIGEIIMSEAGLIHGDKIDILFDIDDGFAFIARRAADEDGFKIGKRANNNHGHITFKWSKDMPLVTSSERIRCQVKDHEIHFEFPPSMFKHLK